MEVMNYVNGIKVKTMATQLANMAKNIKDDNELYIVAEEVIIKYAITKESIKHINNTCSWMCRYPKYSNGYNLLSTAKLIIMKK